MNKIIISGRLTKDVELKATSNGNSVARFTVAVARRTDRNKSDFINCIAWRQQAELINKYFHKGSPIYLIGELLQETYEKDGKRNTIYQVNVNEIEFAMSSKDTKEAEPKKEEPKEEEPKDLFEEEINDDNLPF